MQSVPAASIWGKPTNHRALWRHDWSASDTMWAQSSPRQIMNLKIDFVSDISCPWCAVGLGALQQALSRLPPEISAGVHFLPFELNPQMGPGGQDMSEHLTQKYGSTPQQQAQARENIRRRGAEVGFEFNVAGRGRIYNTFHAHRLLYWAGQTAPDKQGALKLALLQACHRDRQAMDETEVLLAAAETAGLDRTQAAEVLASEAFAQEVRDSQARYHAAGIHAVPAVIINDRHLISGGQPSAVFEQALRQIAAGEV
jgi:predicted DsbA family dithiol-disulfide isomerase